jgi:hypothetical protein
MVRPDFLELVNKTGFMFCRAADCGTVYFHADGEMLKKTDLRVRVGLKEKFDPVPVCYCFGFTERMLLEEIQASGHTTIPERIAAEIKAEHCACEVRNPQGVCCLGNVKAAEKRAQQIAAHAITSAAAASVPSTTPPVHRPVEGRGREVPHWADDQDFVREMAT